MDERTSKERGITMAGIEDILNDYFQAYQKTSQYKDSAMIEIFWRREEFEKRLDEMWTIYGSGVTAQIVEYRKQIDDIKSCGLKVLRNSNGKHKIVMK